MTNSTDPVGPDLTAAVPVPAVLGVSHLGFSVHDLEAASAFWVRVLGFTVLTRLPGLHFLVRPDIRMAVGLTDHGGTVRGPFDEHHVGLDHLALAVPDEPALHAWAAWLDECEVRHSGVVGSDAGRHVNLRAPDGIQIELFVLDPAVAPAFGVTATVPPVAGTH